MSDTTPAPSGAELEATGTEVVPVEYQGQTYAFPASLDDADFEVLEAIDNQKMSHAVRGLLSDADYKRFKATRPKISDAASLFEAYAKVIGLTQGE